MASCFYVTLMKYFVTVQALEQNDAFTPEHE